MMTLTTLALMLAPGDASPEPAACGRTTEAHAHQERASRQCLCVRERRGQNGGGG